MMAAIRVGETYRHISCQYKPGLTPDIGQYIQTQYTIHIPVIFSISLVNLLCPYTYITDTSSAKAMKVSPVAPKLSNRVSQYSPAPVVKTKPIEKHPIATNPTKTGFLMCFKLGWSNSVDMTPSMIPICDPSPRESSIMKKRADQKGAPGILVKTSAITMKANPVP